MLEIKILLKQSSHYLTGQIIMMSAGFISFPILTRIFSVGDYGILGLITTTLFIVTSIAKFGIPESIVRFYAEFKAMNRLNSFYSTFFVASMVIAGGVAICFFLLTRLIDKNFLGANNENLLSLFSVLIFTNCLSGTVTSFLRADQKTKLFNLIAIISKYGSLGVSIFLVFFFIKGLYGFYVGQIVSGITVLFCLMYFSFRKGRIRLSGFSPNILKDSFKFGFPLLLAELGYLVLNYADRYLIQLYLGSIPLGLYVAGYNLATYVTEVIIYPVNYAMTPIYLSILVNKGEEETRKFLTNTFRYFLLIMFPVAFGFIAVGKDLLALLASSKYIEANIIFPYVVIGQSIHASSMILNNGLFIKKKTHLVTIIMISACLVNIGLNILLIPHFGILGAAQATLISYIFHTVVITYYAFKEFSFRIDYAHIVLYLIAALIMFISVKSVHLGGQLENLLNKVGIGVVIYFCLVIIFDKDIRRNVVNFAYSLKK